LPYTPNDRYPINPKPGVVAWLRDRRVIAIAETNAQAIDPTDGFSASGRASSFGGYGGNLFIPLYATLVDLRNIDWVLDINLFSDPKTDVCLGAAYNKKISGNIVGFTVVGVTHFPSGTTIFAEVVAIGPP